MIHENFHTKHRVHSARCTHTYITQLYITSIQPVNKAVEHLMNSTPVFGRGRKKEKEKKAVNTYLIKNSKGGWEGWGAGVLSQAVGRTGRSIMSQSILCNYFKVCTKFTLEGAE